MLCAHVGERATARPIRDDARRLDREDEEHSAEVRHHFRRDPDTGRWRPDARLRADTAASGRLAKT